MTSYSLLLDILILGNFNFPHSVFLFIILHFFLILSKVKASHMYLLRVWCWTPTILLSNPGSHPSCTYTWCLYIALPLLLPLTKSLHCSSHLVCNENDVVPTYTESEVHMNES